MRRRSDARLHRKRLDAAVSLPVAAALRDKTSFTARGGLRTRPLAELLRAMEPNGVSADRDTAPLTLSGRLQSGTFAIRGDVSSQYISGLLFALPLLSGDSRFVLLTALSSAGYVDMTLTTRCPASAFALNEDGRRFLRSRGDQIYHGPSSLRAEGARRARRSRFAAGRCRDP